MTALEKKQQRLDLVKDTMEFKNDRVLFMSNGQGYDYLGFLHSRLTPTEFFRDIDKAEKYYMQCAEQYQFDIGTNTGGRNSSYREILGADGVYHFNDEAKCIEMMDFNADKPPRMSPDEYDEFLANPDMFRWKKVLSRVYGDLSYQQLQDALNEMMRTSKKVAEMNKTIAEKYGSINISRFGYLNGATEMMYFYRGLKNLSLDMRRCPEKIEAVNDIGEPGILARLAKSLENPRTDAAFSIRIGLVAHSIMNNKQFARFMYPTQKKCIDMILAKNEYIFVYAEGDLIRLKDFYSDIPKGNLCVEPEMESVQDVRKAYPNAVVAGGIPVWHLGHSSLDVCKEETKKIIDEMGPGYIAATDKIIACQRDFTEENLHGIIEFVQDYKL